MGKSRFDEIVKHKVIPIAGDIISPDLSMTDADREQIIEHVHIVIHCAAALNYNERLDLALEVRKKKRADNKKSDLFVIDKYTWHIKNHGFG